MTSRLCVEDQKSKYCLAGYDEHIMALWVQKSFFSRLLQAL